MDSAECSELINGLLARIAELTSRVAVLEAQITVGVGASGDGGSPVESVDTGLLPCYGDGESVEHDNEADTNITFREEDGKLYVGVYYS